MKIILFSGGLGNQIFGYAFYLYLKKQFPNEKIFGIYNKLYLHEHNGLEINKHFNVNLPPESFKANLLSVLLFLYKKIYPTSKLLDLNQRKCVNRNAIFYMAFKLTKEYIPIEDNWICFKETAWDEKNIKILTRIRDSNSVFVHIRRSDYLSPKYKQQFQGCCTIEYYKKAIHRICITKDNPVFYVFSDDISWTKENLHFESDAIYIDWNKGTNNVIDMLLMSYCQNGIIANSTFSYWAARLNRKKQIIYPLNWINAKEGQPNIFPPDWEGL
jgi:hypothetical protein